MFQGFSEDTIAFFAALSFNNNKQFFDENRLMYENAVRKPLIALAEALAPAVQAIDPQMDVRPARAVSRINRDVRFRRDKSPYKTYMWIGYRHVGETRQETCGFYFDISAESANWGCGFYNMPGESMQNLRHLMREEPARVRKIVEDKALTARFALLGDAYVRQHRPPEGMAESLAALYPKKGLYAQHTLGDGEDLFSPSLADVIAADFAVLAPLYKLFRECMVKKVEGAVE